MSLALSVRRLGSDDVALARQALRLVVEVFEEESKELSEAYVARLLARDDFWLIAALRDGTPVGGLTAHALPMTRDETTELFLYDLAVHEAHQRLGIGRALVQTLLELANAHGIHVAFVPADIEDEHALEFYRALDAEEAPVSIFTWDHSVRAL